MLRLTKTNMANWKLEKNSSRPWIMQPAWQHGAPFLRRSTNAKSAHWWDGRRKQFLPKFLRFPTLIFSYFDKNRLKA